MTFDVKPGGSVNIPLKHALAKLLAKQPPTAVPLASVDSIRVQLERIFFSNGTIWSHGAYQKPDASSTGHYVPITPEEWKSLVAQ